MARTLWAPWRMDYITGPKTPGCVFCNVLAEGDSRSEENLVLRFDRLAFVIMNRFPYAHGHIMVVPRRHVAALEQLPEDERAALFQLLVAAQSTLKRALAPQGMNIGMNLGQVAGAGIEDHVHIHIVPRWTGDTNFMPLFADVKVMPEHLDETRRKLAEPFAELARAGRP